MDYWSLLSDDEVNAVVLSREFAIEMEQMSARDLAESHEIRPEKWENRPRARQDVKEVRFRRQLFARWL